MALVIVVLGISLCFGGARRAGAQIPGPARCREICADSWPGHCFSSPLLTRPFVRLLTWSSNSYCARFEYCTTFTETKYSLDEIRQLVDEASKSGTVDVQAGEIATRALELEHVRARDVMIPRQEVVAIPRHAKVEEVHRILLEHGHTRLPVFERQLDNVVGYLNVKDILAVAWDPRLFILEDLVRPAYFVPESVRALDSAR